MFQADAPARPTPTNVAAYLRAPLAPAARRHRRRDEEHLARLVVVRDRLLVARAAPVAEHSFDPFLVNPIQNLHEGRLPFLGIILRGQQGSQRRHAQMAMGKVVSGMSRCLQQGKQGHRKRVVLARLGSDFIFNRQIGQFPAYDVRHIAPGLFLLGENSASQAAAYGVEFL